MTMLGRNTKQTTTGMGGFYNRLKSVNMRLANINKDANRASMGIKGLGKSFGGLNSVMNIAKFYLVAHALKSFVNAALDAIETTNLFAVSMGGALDSANRFIDAMHVAFGLDQTNLKNAVGTFGLLSRSMGINNENAETLSTTMGKLGLDLSSLMNVPINQVMGDLRSGLLGQSETVYKYGIDVTEASLKTEALAQGISKSVRNMSQGEKMALRYAVMLKQTGLAQGDFSRTLESPANQARILQERFVTLSRSIGNIFIPVLSKVLPYLNAVMIAMIRIADMIAKLVGFVMPTFEVPTLDTIKSGAEDAEDAVGSLATKMKQFSSGMDELNVIDTSAPSGGGGGGPSIGDVNDFDFATYDNMMDQASTRVQEIADRIMGAFTTVYDYISTVTAPLDGVFTPISDIVLESFRTFYEDILLPLGGFILTSFIPNFFIILAETITILGKALEGMQPGFQFIYDRFIQPAFTGALALTSILLDRMSEALKQLNKWIDANRTTFDKLMETIGIVMTVISLLVASFIGIMQTIKLFSVITMAVTSPLGLVVIAIMALIAIGYLLIDNWAVVSAFFGAFGDFIKAKFDEMVLKFQEFTTSLQTGYDGTIAPVMGYIQTLFQMAVTTIVTLWNTLLKPTITAIINIFKAIGTTLWFVVTEFIIPLVQEWIDHFTNLWNQHLVPFLAELGKFVMSIIGFFAMIRDEFLIPLFNEFVKTLEWIIADFVMPMVQTFMEYLLPKLRNAFTFIADIFFIFLGVVIDVATGVLDFFGGVLDFFTGLFTGDLKLALSGIESMFTGMLTVVSGVGTGIVNVIIEVVNGMLRAVANGINFVVRQMNKISFDVPDWVPGIGGMSFGVSLNEVEPFQIPKLARGGSLTDGDLFEAGESGKAEAIGSFNNKTTVMPLENTDFVDAIYRAVFRGMTESQEEGGSVIENVLNLDGETIYRNQQRVARGRGIDFGMGVFAR